MKSILVKVLRRINSKKLKRAREDYMILYNRFNKGETETLISSIEAYTEKYKYNFYGWNLLGVVCNRLEEYSKAETSFNRAIKLQPRFKEAIVGLGSVYRAQGRVQEAEHLYLEALKLDANYAEAYSSLMIIEFIRQNTTKALEYGEKSYRLSPNNGLVSANLAVAYHLVKNFEKRDVFIEKARKLSYHNIIALDNLKNDKEGDVSFDSF